MEFLSLYKVLVSSFIPIYTSPRYPLSTSMLNSLRKNDKHLAKKLMITVHVYVVDI